MSQIGDFQGSSGDTPFRPPKGETWLLIRFESNGRREVDLRPTDTTHYWYDNNWILGTEDDNVSVTWIDREDRILLTNFNYIKRRPGSTARHAMVCQRYT